MASILIFGERGQLARSLAKVGKGLDLQFLGRSAVNPARLGSLDAIIAQQNPALVLNAAAYTLVDLAEKERDAAYTLNCELPRQIAISCSRRKIPFVHISTDYVFDGTKATPYLETDHPNPLGVYGASKLEGDRAILRIADVPYAILRTSWVFSHVGDTFPRKIIRRARELGRLRVVDDQLGCPTPSDELARVMLMMSQRLMDSGAEAEGLFNCCGDTAMTWREFAGRIVAAARAYGLGDCVVEPMSSSELQLAAKRPANSVLDCSRLKERRGIASLPIDASIDECAAELMAV